MKFFFTIFFFIPALVFAQEFRTMVPQVPVVAGQAFQVQYVLEDADNTVSLVTPSFQGCRFIAGPNVYNGRIQKDGQQISTKNFVFTLEAVRTGRITIPAALCSLHGKKIKSNTAFITVISPTIAMAMEENPNTLLFLKPGEDPARKIADNLFLELEVDKKICYVGEPVVATFRLFSRLQSRSDVMKNPGFYGFSVYDMVNVNDNVVTTENRDGKLFDVHTVRKVQLYPLQPGHFTIDPMEISNKVEFARSAVNRTTEQQVTENMYGRKEEGNASIGGNEVYSSTNTTLPVVINVKSLPGKNTSDSFMGAVGNFDISARMEKPSFAQNQVGALIISVKGAGNFPQVNPPTITWPAGVESFEPEVHDSFDKKNVPLKGERIFRFGFIASHPGDYTIPAIEFSFFDLQAKKFKKLIAPPVKFLVAAAEARAAIQPPQQAKGKKPFPPILIFIFAMILILLMNFFARKRKEKKQQQVTREMLDRDVQLPGPHQYLQDAKNKLDTAGTAFFLALNKGTWDYFIQKTSMRGSFVTKDYLLHILQRREVPEEAITELFEIMHQTEAGMYSGVAVQTEKNVLLERTMTLLNIIDQKFS